MPSRTTLRRIGYRARVLAVVFVVSSTATFAGTSMVKGQVLWQYFYGASASSTGTSASASSTAPAPVTNDCCDTKTGQCVPSGLGCAGVVMGSACATSCKKAGSPSSAATKTCCIPSTGLCQYVGNGCPQGSVVYDDMAKCALKCTKTPSSSPGTPPPPASSAPPKQCCNLGTYTCGPLLGNGTCPPLTFPLDASTCAATCGSLKPKPVSSKPPSSSSSSSSSSRTSSIPSSVAASSSNSSAVRCCTCYYQEHAQCDTRTALNCMPNDCYDGIDNDRDGKIDGKGSNRDPGCITGFGYTDESELPGYQPMDCALSAAGSCIGRHLALCQDTTRPEFAGCNQIRALPKGTITPLPAEWKCTDPKVIEFGHEIPGQCSGVQQRIEDVLNCTDAGCPVEFKNAGCGVAQNLDDWHTCLPKFQDLMAKRGIPVLVLELEQTTHVVDQCTTTVRFEITQDTANETYGPCSFGSKCPTAEQAFKCTYQSSPLITKNGICCRGPNGKIRMEDTFGGTCPNFCRTGYSCEKAGTVESCTPYPAGTPQRSQICCTQFGGYLSYKDGASCPAGQETGDATSRVTKASCGDAQKEALAVAQERIADEHEKCDLTPGSTFKSSCTTTKFKSSWVPYSCTYDGACDWTCSW